MIHRLFMATFLATFVATTLQASEPSASVPLIFDTDIGNDVDLYRYPHDFLSGKGAPVDVLRKARHLYDHKEYNIIKVIPAAKNIATTWPTEIV